MQCSRAESAWPSVSLSDLCEKTSTTNPSSRPDEFFKYVDVSSVSNESFKIVGANRLQGRDAPSRARQLVQFDDVIFATVRPALRRVAMIPQELHGEVCSTGFCVLRANKQRLNPNYLYCYLLSEEVRQKVEALQTGATYPAINDGDLFRLAIPLPSLTEQSAIAHVLQTVQKAKDTRQHELDLERERKSALMEHLFTHGTQSEATKASEIGEIPDGWSLKPLSDVADIAYGVQAAVAHLTDPSGGIPILTNVNIKNEGDLNLDTLRYFPLPKKMRSRAILAHGDVLFNWRSGSQNHVGKTAIFEEEGEFTFSSFILRFRPTGALFNRFLFYFLQAIKSRGYFTQNRQQSSVNSVFNASVAATIPIPLPAMGEQEEIASCLFTCDRKIHALEAEIRCVEELFNAMLQQLMGGELSVTPLVREGYA
ncbi:restriction endonuclease subunit S [Occallatibacter savannae]|uniref:restriction endonuclease subunit S n=1 Tax=Occallatibacter savannae TaxID=1002691 RepID=UPI000D69C8AB|nr:restriction endonuclease subunit S [Occallatibacter savannae]